MVSQEQIKKFINEIAPCAQVGYRRLGKVLPSICIAMACVESAYGTAGSCFHNSYLGQKVGSGKTATTYWNGKFFTSKTKEEYTIGTHTTITAAFRSYEDMQQCVLNYYELLNTRLYSGVKAGVPYQVQMQQIKNCGYMTSSTEVASVLRLIEKYNLTKYDTGIETVDPAPATGNPYKEPTKNVRLNSKGNDVRWLQYALNSKGGYKLIVDGVAGNLTIGAVMDWQKKNGLTVDGIAGPKTIASLR